MFLEDENNKLWLATSDGLYSYDKQTQTVKEYNASNSNMPGNIVYGIYQDSSKRFWVGTDKGLWRLDRKTDQVKLVTLDTKSLEVRSVFVSQTGRLLVGTTHGLFIYQENTFRKVLFGSNALSSTNFLTGIVEGHKDTFWLTSQGGLIEYNIVTGQSEVYTYQGDERFKRKAIFRNSRQWYACF